MIDKGFSIGDTEFRLLNFPEERADILEAEIRLPRLIRQNLTITSVEMAQIDRPVGLPGGKFHGGVFDAVGRPVPEAALRQRTSVTIGTTRSIPSADTFSMAEAMYGGLLPNRYGHIILEALARLWAADSLPGLPILFQCVQPPTDNHAIFRLADLLGISRDRFVFENRSGIVRRLHVPESGLQLQNSIHIEYKCFLEEKLRAIREPSGPERIYLSRSGLGSGSRRAIDEFETEQAFVDNHYRPERLETTPLDYQIRRIGSVAALSGYIGSQFHNLVFRDRDRPIDVLYICDDKPSLAYLIIDLLTPGTKTYVNAIHYRPYVEVDITTPFRTDRSVLLRAISTGNAECDTIIGKDTAAEDVEYRKLWCASVIGRLANWYLGHKKIGRDIAVGTVSSRIGSILQEAAIATDEIEQDGVAQAIVSAMDGDRVLADPIDRFVRCIEKAGGR